MRGRLLAGLMCLLGAQAAARATPDAVEEFFRETESDTSLSEVFVPETARELSFSLRFDGTGYSLMRAVAAPQIRSATPRFGKPGPWLLVYDPRGRRVIYASRLPDKPQAHIEQLDSSTGRWLARRIDPTLLRDRLRLPVLGNSQVFIGSSAKTVRLLTAIDASSNSERPYGCPAAFRILGARPPETAINILVLPSGFESDEDLDVFRCAAHRLFSQLLQSNTPYAALADRTNVYRMDLRDSDPRTLTQTLGCQAEATDWANRATDCADPASYQGTPWATLEAAGNDAAVAEIPLENLSRTTGPCNVVFPSSGGQTVAGDLAACVPGVAFDAVVILANSGFRFGGGDWTPTPPIVVASLARVAETDGWLLLGHELGHALGLLDEYQEGSGPDYTPARNVISLEEVLAGLEPSWSETCRSPVDGTAICGSNVLDGKCEIVCEPPIPSGCCSWSTPELLSWPIVGLWEGAQYQECGYFRSRQLCVMGDFTMLSLLPDPPFCPACDRRMTSELTRWTESAEDVFDTYLGWNLTLLELGHPGPPVFAVPFDWITKPPRVGELRALVKTRYGTAVIIPDRIEAVVKRRDPHGEATRCRVRIDKSSPLRCSTQCPDEATSEACLDAVASLVGNGFELRRARAILGGRSFDVQGIRVKRRR